MKETIYKEESMLSKILAIYLSIICVCQFSLEARLKDRYRDKEFEPCIYLFPDGAQRIGDHLLVYIKAQWISYKTGLPLCIYPSKYYKNFPLIEKESIVTSLPKRGIQKIQINNFPTFLEKTPNTFYIVSYYPYPSMDLLYEMKKDRVFIKRIQEMLVPTKKIPFFELPKDRTTVAVHIRKGTGIDDPLKSVQIFNKEKIVTKNALVSRKKYGDFIHPLKFAPEQYYIDQIKFLSEYLENKPLYVFIFTDDPNPFKIMKRVKNEVALDNIAFDCFHAVGRSEEELLRDFFLMMKFDCLIRPGRSYFSTISELLCEQKIVIYPKSHHFEKDEKDNYYLIMDNIQLIESL